MNTISKVILYLILVKVVLVGILCLTKKGYSHINYSKIIEPNVNILDEEFYFYIRGHIRNSFETDRLKNFVNKLKQEFPNIKFILQTWRNKECKKGNSHKRIIESNTIITIDKIKDYFEDDDIVKNCIIIDEDDIELIGNLEGKVSKSRANIKGWKNMWYGINKGLEQINHHDRDKLVVNFRYDYFNIPQTVYNENQVINFIYKYLDNNKINFIQTDGPPGIDNLYMGTVKDMKMLVKNFNTNLDNITKSKFNKNVVYQEEIVYNVADMMNNIFN